VAAGRGKAGPPPRQAPARRGRARAPEKRERILGAALRLFTTRGFHQTPTARISREAGVSTGTLFHYFPDKNTLIDELYLSIQREVAGAVRKRDDASLPVRDRLGRCFRAYLTWGVSNPGKVRFLSLFYNSPRIGEEVKKEAHREFRWLEELSLAAVREGAIRDLPREFYAVMIPQVLQGILLLIASGETGMSEEEIVESGLGMILKEEGRPGEIPRSSG